MGGGSGSSGGGGGSGKVDYPAYMKVIHANLLAHSDLNGGGADSVSQSIIDSINAALGNSPYSGKSANDPAVALAAVDTAICNFDALVDALSWTSDWETGIQTATTMIDDNIISSAAMDADASAFGVWLSQEVDTNTLPRFRAGMRDINAVISSSFTLGEALIESRRVHEVAKYRTELGMKGYILRSDMIIKSTERIMTSLFSRVEFEKAVASLTSEAKRIRVVAEKEEVDKNLEIDGSDARWDLETYQYAGNLLAGIGGGAVSSGSGGKVSPMQSAHSGALGGASVGAAGGGPWGAAIGGAIGFGAALLG